MFQIPCPHCGLRNVSEFRHVGERRARPNVQTATREQWRAFLYGQDNAAGWSAETWYHSYGCRRFVGVERHTVTNSVRPVTGSEDSAAPDAESTS